jgi:hypothetical protein
LAIQLGGWQALLIVPIPAPVPLWRDWTQMRCGRIKSQRWRVR